MNKAKTAIKISIIIILTIMLLLSLLLQCFIMSDLFNYEKFDNHNNDNNNITQNYGMITDENIDKIKLCVNDSYEKLMLHNEEKELEIESINPGDFIYIKKLKINDNKKTYLIYLYDVESNVLYYLYSK